ncbi:uncharacterized protein LOC116120753 [Pistacia vera]|uniref:uncharacterized protein LOC116120753 n=1 Tax=Pistacia vera TaxID=55513 RepID=UPI001262F6CB|nr:uncharacterized protein LOC116120753 [Pistacia vera]
MAVARLFYDSCIPTNVINSIYFQPMVDAITAIGPGYKIPTYHNLRVNLLRDARKEVQLLVDGYKKTWEDVGCTLMADGWTDSSHRSLINFLVYCPKGVCFVKSVDASDVVKDAATLFSLFEEIALWVGLNNIVHLVTDNRANYKVAGRMLSEKYSSTTWFPCAGINLMLKDIAEMSYIVNLSTRASESTVTDRTFVESQYAKTNKGKAFISIVLDNRFWDDIGIISKVVSPLMRMLRIVDLDERPSIGYVYDGMYQTRMGIKKLFKNKKKLYKPYTTIIKMRWDRMLRRDIHAATYYLNPAFKYDEDTFSKKFEVMYGFLDTIDSKASAFKMSKTTLLEESRLYRDRLESFSHELALQTCKTTWPALMTYELQKQYENMDAHAIILHLKELYQKNARHEKYQVSKAMFRSRMAEGAQSISKLLNMLRIAKQDLKKSKPVLLVVAGEGKGKSKGKTKVYPKSKPKAQDALKSEGRLAFWM